MINKLTKDDIIALLPHREPMLLIDELSENKEDMIESEKSDDKVSDHAEISFKVSELVFFNS